MKNHGHILRAPGKLRKPDNKDFSSIIFCFWRAFHLCMRYPGSIAPASIFYLLCHDFSLYMVSVCIKRFLGLHFRSEAEVSTLNRSLHNTSEALFHWESFYFFSSKYSFYFKFESLQVLLGFLFCFLNNSLPLHYCPTASCYGCRTATAGYVR